MPASPIRKLTPYAEQARHSGKKVYHLNIGQPDIHTPQVMIDAIHSVDFEVWEYTQSEGTESYRTKLAEYYNRAGYQITPGDILVTSGASEAIVIAMQTCLDSGDEIIIPEPFYANYSAFAWMSGVVIKPVLSFIETGFALPPIREFEKLITPKTKAIFICNPNNPSGYLYSREELVELKNLCLKYDLYLFADEAYREFCYDGQQFYSPMHLEGFDQNVIIFDSISKRYSACGARIGCFVTRNKSVLTTALKFAQARLSPGMVDQIAAEAGTDTPEAYFEVVNREYTDRRNLLVESLNKMEGVFCPKPRGAFYAVARLPVDDSEKFCQWILEKFEYDNQTVMMAPAAGFYCTEGAGKDEVRLAYVLNKEDLMKAMVCLEKALEAYPGRMIRKNNNPSEKPLVEESIKAID